MTISADYLQANFKSLRITDEVFTNDKGEKIKYNNFYLVVDKDGKDRAYQVKLTADSKAVLRADALEDRDEAK